MSLPWSKSVRLQIAPDGVRATLERGWPSHGALAEVVHAGPAFDPQQPGTGDNDKADLLELVLRDLEAAGGLRGARLHVVLDDALVHVDVAEGDFGGMSERELKGIARACITEILGDAADRRELRWTLQPDERHLAICAVDRDDLGLLADAARLRGMQLASVQSHFASSWNLHARRQQAERMVFVVGSGMQAIVACVVDRSICALSTGPWLDRPSAQRQTQGAMARCGLDDRVDRLLACLGIEVSGIGAFVAVLQEAKPLALSGRWTVAQAHEATP